MLAPVTTDTIRRFAARDLCLHAHLLHACDPPSPELERAKRVLYGGPEEAPIAFFADDPTEPRLVATRGDALFLEGTLAPDRAGELAAWLEEASPRVVGTRSEALKEVLAGVFGREGWRRQGLYGCAPGELRPRPGSHEVRPLVAGDGAAMDALVAANRHEGIVDRAAGGSGSVPRDYRFMCDGLPVACYGAFEDGALVGMISTVAVTDGYDSVCTLFVDRRYRRRGIAAALLSRAVADRHAEGHGVDYGAANDDPGICALVTGLGFRRTATGHIRWC